MLNPVVVAGGGDPWADADAGAARGWDLHRHRGGEEEAAWGGEEEGTGGEGQERGGLPHLLPEGDRERERKRERER